MKTRKGALWCLGVFAVSPGPGCGQKTDLMPLETGKSWTYITKAGFNTFVEPVKVVRRMPVAGTEGYELVGPLGSSRLAWKDGVLFASTTANARFMPALPLVYPGKEERKWQGRMESNGKTYDATARISLKQERLKVGGGEVGTTLSTILLQIPDTGIELKTWFQPGVGIVQQEQRINRVLKVHMQLLND
jgi:hypothetical protein